MLTKGSSGAQMKLFSNGWQPQPGPDYEADVSGLEVDRDAGNGWWSHHTWWCSAVLAAARPSKKGCSRRPRALRIILLYPLLRENLVCLNWGCYLSNLFIKMLISVLIHITASTVKKPLLVSDMKTPSCNSMKLLSVLILMNTRNNCGTSASQHIFIHLKIYISLQNFLFKTVFWTLFNFLEVLNQNTS